MSDFDSSDALDALAEADAAAAAAVDAEEQALADLFDPASLGADATDFGTGFLDAGATDNAGSDGGLFDVGAPAADPSALGAGLFGSDTGGDEDIGLGAAVAADGAPVTSSFDDAGFADASSLSDLLDNILQLVDPAAQLDPLQALAQSLLSAASGFEVSPDELSADDLGNVLGQVSGAGASTFLDAFSSSGDASFVDFSPTDLMSSWFGGGSTDPVYAALTTGQAEVPGPPVPIYGPPPLGDPAYQTAPSDGSTPYPTNSDGGPARQYQLGPPPPPATAPPAVPPAATSPPPSLLQTLQGMYGDATPPAGQVSGPLMQAESATPAFGSGSLALVFGPAAPGAAAAGAEAALAPAAPAAAAAGAEAALPAAGAAAGEALGGMVPPVAAGLVLLGAIDRLLTHPGLARGSHGPGSASPITRARQGGAYGSLESIIGTLYFLQHVLGSGAPAPAPAPSTTGSDRSAEGGGAPAGDASGGGRDTSEGGGPPDAGAGPPPDQEVDPSPQQGRGRFNRGVDDVEQLEGVGRAKARGDRGKGAKIQSIGKSEKRLQNRLNRTRDLSDAKDDFGYDDE